MGIKIGVVGCGAFSADFIRLFNNHPDVDEVAVADVFEERARSTAEKFGLKRYFLSLDDMLENGSDLDSIAIFTQRHLHGPMIIKALKQGKHV